MNGKQAPVDNGIRAVNAAHRRGREPTLAALGGEELVASHARTLAESDIAGETAAALAREWSTIQDRSSAVQFLRAAIESAPPHVMRRVADAVVTLPAVDAGRVTASVLDAATSSDDAFRAETARDCAVRLAAVGATTWDIASALATANRPTAIGWPGSMLAARTARRLAAFHPESSDTTLRFLTWLSDENPGHADPLAATGAVHLLTANRDAPGFQADMHQARTAFTAAARLDPEHDEAILAAALIDVALSVAGDDSPGAAASAAEAARSLGRLGRFRFRDEDVCLPASAYASWAHATVLADRAARLAVDRHSNAPSAIVTAAADALRAATAMPAYGGLVMSALRSSGAFASDLVDTMRYLMAKPEGDPDGRIAALLAEVEPRGKVEAGGRPERSIEDIRDQLVDVLTEAGRMGDAALAANIGADPLTGTPVFDRKLRDIDRVLSDDQSCPDETRRRAAMVVSFVLRYVMRKAEATKQFGGFRDLAGAEIAEPAELHVQKDFAQAFAIGALGDGWVDEKTNVSAGRVDGMLRVGRDEFPFEIKAERDDSSPEALRRYVGQADRYTGGNAPLAFLIVLDLTRGDRYNDLTEQSWIATLPPAQTGRNRHVVTAVIPANSPVPSILSKATASQKRHAKRRRGDNPPSSPVLQSDT